MIWPERADSWQYGAYAARKAFLRVIETISESESMTVLCSEGQYDNARAQLPDRVRLVVMETDDAWARDVGPTFVRAGVLCHTRTPRKLSDCHNTELCLLDIVQLGTKVTTDEPTGTGH